MNLIKKRDDWIFIATEMEQYVTTSSNKKLRQKLSDVRDLIERMTDLIGRNEKLAQQSPEANQVGSRQ